MTTEQRERQASSSSAADAERYLPIDKLVILGLGLIGGSLAAGLRQRAQVARVVAWGRRAESLARGQALGHIDAYTLDLAEALDGADVVVIATPTLVCERVLAQLPNLLASGTVVTDVASVKGNLLRTARRVWGQEPANLVLAHPIAGSERSGVEAARADLFDQHRVILTPTEHTSPAACAKVRAMWQAVDAEVVEMTVERHDEVLAATSHLPHLLAYTLVDNLARKDRHDDIFRFAAGGFRDFTRIASSDPQMWHDISLANRDALLAMLDSYSEHLARLRQFIDAGDSEQIIALFGAAKAARDRFAEQLSLRGLAAGTEASPMQQSLTIHASPGGRVRGRCRVPGDKSISHRAIMLGSLAEGCTQISGFLEGHDTLATLEAFRAMGVSIEGPARGQVAVHGVGMGGLRPPAEPLFLGNSGTSMRLLAGLMVAQPFSVTLIGDASLSGRPMERVAAPLRLMGAGIDSGPSGVPPLLIHGGRALVGIDYALPMASAQVKSCLLLAGLYARGQTSVTEPAPTRDHTERMLCGFGYPVSVDGATATVRGGGTLQACAIDVPADISSAAFFLVAASIAPASDLLLEHVGVNPTRTGVIDILRLMGADIAVQDPREVGGEPVADLRVRSAPLHGIEIPAELVPLAIDEFPVLFVAAACAQGETLLRGAAELRVKESDRIQVMADGLATLGIDAVATGDGICIQGGALGGGVVESHGDHRIAMAFSVAALAASDEIRILDCANVATSFPGFLELARELGLRVRAG